MFVKLANWLDDRTGYRKIVSAMLIEDIPGGAKWRYVWGSCLAFVFMVQLVTGVLLMTAYSPGDTTAWSSVYFIQYQMDFGWLIRGLHHFGSQTMVVLLGLHMLQVVIAGAHLPPREINWWLGLALMGAVLGLSLTGYLLPWDMKGYYATKVATNIAGNLPILGAFIQRIVVGGPEYGNHTLTRFYALHVGILPPLVIALTALHIYVFRRHGVTAPQDADGEGWFWPDQAFKDLLACLVIFGIMLSLVVAGDGHKLEAGEPAPEAGAEVSLYQKWAQAGREGRGANLDAPADRSKGYPARPEWYFLALFQLLKYFEGDLNIIGTFVIPNGIVVVLLLLPLLALGRKREDGSALRTFAQIVGVLVVVGLLMGVAALTCLAIADDTVDSLARETIKLIGTKVVPIIAAFFVLYLGILGLLKKGTFKSVVHGLGVVALAVLLGGAGYLLRTAAKDPGQLPPQLVAYVKEHMTKEQKEPKEEAIKFQGELKEAEEQAGRAINLAGAGVPTEGAMLLLRHDPMTAGKQAFKTNCAVCHAYGEMFKDPKNPVEPTASDLKGFGTEKWIRDLLRDPGNTRFFGHTGLKKMTNWVQRNKKPDIEAEFDLIAKWLSEHPERIPADPKQSPGWVAFEKRCTSCHGFADLPGSDEPGTPNFTGYGSPDWLRLMIMMPASSTRYAARNTMPAFRDLEGPTAPAIKLEMQAAKDLLLGEEKGNAKKKEEVEKACRMINLSDVDRELIIRFVLQDDRVVFGGEPISGPPKMK